jgi:hypothetical protein
LKLGKKRTRIKAGKKQLQKSTRRQDNIGGDLNNWREVPTDEDQYSDSNKVGRVQGRDWRMM